MGLRHSICFFDSDYEDYGGPRFQVSGLSLHPSPVGVRHSGPPSQLDQIPKYADSSRMTTLTLAIPEALLLQDGASLSELSREAQKEIAFHFFRTGRATSGQAAEMAEMNRVEFMLEAGRRKIPLLDLDTEELKQEIDFALGELA